MRNVDAIAVLIRVVVLLLVELSSHVVKKLRKID